MILIFLQRVYYSHLQEERKKKQERERDDWIAMSLMFPDQTGCSKTLASRLGSEWQARRERAKESESSLPYHWIIILPQPKLDVELFW